MTQVNGTPVTPESFDRNDGLDSILLTLNNHLAQSETLDEVFQKLVDVGRGLIDAERGAVFLNDDNTNELYSRMADAYLRREIRILNTSGVAGWVFSNEEAALIEDAYNDERFNPQVDKRTGYKTRNILCVPLFTYQGDIIGVNQLLNKREGSFTQADLDLFAAITNQAALTLQSFAMIERIEENRKQELDFLEVVSQVSTELQLNALLQKIIATISKMLDAERSTLFINDEKTNELYTEIGEGLGATRIRFPNHLGIAGAVFTSGDSINIPHAYADLRFNPSFDRETGFFTRSILCQPVVNKAGKVIGVTQVLNKRGGSFSAEDEARLAAFTSQISMGIQNAKLFDDVQNIKNYNEGILESMSNGVLTIDDEHVIVTCNASCERILSAPTEEVVGQKAEDFFGEENDWLIEKINAVASGEDADDSGTIMDAELHTPEEKRSVNATVTPLIGVKEENLGIMVMLEDISNEKRMKSTMSRYMEPALAEKLMSKGEELLGGTNSVATVLFTDLRSFTTLTEGLGAEGTVRLLNEYFTFMVDCVQTEEGMLDKFIGDAMLAVFGTPFPHDDDPDRAVRAAIRMMRELYEFNDLRVSKGLMSIDHGMGINTDSVVSGNIGSPKRMDYTVIGDGVNLAARLESACKQYGAHILISEFTFRELKATYRTREVDKVVVKGKTEPVTVHEVLDYYDDQSFPHMIDVLGHFKDGVSLYKKGEWDSAISRFHEALSANPNDQASKLYIDRCEHLKANPPKGEWEGVWVMTSK